MNATMTPTTVLDNVLPIARDADTERLARIALSVCADSHGEIVAQANTYGILTTLRALATGRPHSDGTEIPATALVGRLTKEDLLQTLQRAAECGIRAITPADPEWPPGLVDLGPAQPLVLWVKGMTRLLGERQGLVALTGARNATTYGVQAATALAIDLVQRGQIIVSGTGDGIAAAVHRAAVVVPAPSVAVAPCGLDRPHPADHADLQLSITELGGLMVSECPPGTPPTRTRALRAAQLVAAIATTTVVVEARVGSVELRSAHEAVRLGRTVGAVPGPLTSQSSEGCHRLIQQGETALIIDADDVVAMIRTRDA